MFDTTFLKEVGFRYEITEMPATSTAEYRVAVAYSDDDVDWTATPVTLTTFSPGGLRLLIRILKTRQISGMSHQKHV